MEKKITILIISDDSLVIVLPEEVLNYPQLVASISNVKDLIIFNGLSDNLEKGHTEEENQLRVILKDEDEEKNYPEGYLLEKIEFFLKNYFGEDFHILKEDYSEFFPNITFEEAQENFYNLPEEEQDEISREAEDSWKRFLPRFKRLEEQRKRNQN